MLLAGLVAPMKLEDNIKLNSLSTQ